MAAISYCWRISHSACEPEFAMPRTTTLCMCGLAHCSGHCEIKQAQRGEKMEVMLKGSTKVLKSPKKFDVSNLDFKDDGPVSISLAHINSYNVYI